MNKVFEDNHNLKVEQPVMMKIEKVVDEAKDTKTFVFNGCLNATPGQFVNIWIPGLDEKPYSISFQQNGRFAITCFAVGPFSRKLNTMKPGDYVGIRGPYGKGFTLKRGNVALIGGGCGTAPLAFLADELAKIGSNVDFIIGARTKELLLYEKRFSNYAGGRVRMHIATDDGSRGFKGFSTGLFEKLLNEKRIDFVYICGPEMMMKKAIDICDKYNKNCEISIERYMKCGIGICGSCCIDNLGIRICTEGPVFDKEIVKKMFEFAKYKRDASGRKFAL
ncbi:MAG: dihydroorotate dehydrogenase electron transfer subunit [Candidatus Woesearchaeota archaeon]|nr:dihydroorotate dehydrogenase electron transfer subunit [Candidatus Woesearchaeota archaeon]